MLATVLTISGWIQPAIPTTILVPQSPTVSSVEVTYDITYDSQTNWENIQTGVRRAAIEKILSGTIEANEIYINCPVVRHASSFIGSSFDGTLDFAGSSGFQDYQILTIQMTVSYTGKFAEQFIGTGQTPFTFTGRTAVDGYGLGCFLYEELLTGSLTITVHP